MIKVSRYELLTKVADFIADLEPGGVYTPDLVDQLRPLGFKWDGPALMASPLGFSDLYRPLRFGKHVALVPMTAGPVHVATGPNVRTDDLTGAICDLIGVEAEITPWIVPQPARWTKEMVQAIRSDAQSELH